MFGKEYVHEVTDLRKQRPRTLFPIAVLERRATGYTATDLNGVVEDFEIDSEDTEVSETKQQVTLNLPSGPIIFSVLQPTSDVLEVHGLKYDPANLSSTCLSGQ